MTSTLAKIEGKTNQQVIIHEGGGGSPNDLPELNRERSCCMALVVVCKPVPWVIPKKTKASHEA
jgi:hypothetical protein